MQLEPYEKQILDQEWGELYDCIENARFNEFVRLWEEAQSFGFPVDYCPNKPFKSYKYVDLKPLLYAALITFYNTGERDRFVRFLLDQGADVNILTRNYKNNNALILISICTDYETTPVSNETYRRIVEQTKDVNYRNSEGETALMRLFSHYIAAVVASIYNPSLSEEIEEMFMPKIKLLIEAGADAKKDLEDIKEGLEMKYERLGLKSWLRHQVIPKLGSIIDLYQENLKQVNEKTSLSEIPFSFDYEL